MKIALPSGTALLYKKIALFRDYPVQSVSNAERQGVGRELAFYFAVDDIRIAEEVHLVEIYALHELVGELIFRKGVLGQLSFLDSPAFYAYRELLSEELQAVLGERRSAAAEVLRAEGNGDIKAEKLKASLFVLFACREYILGAESA